MPLTRTSAGDVLFPANRGRAACWSGFTIIELLVVIGIIAVLMSLLVPAVIRARGAARRTQCLHRMSQVGKALNIKAISKGHYPGFVNATAATRRVDRPTAASWVTVILPELGRRDVADMVFANEGRVESSLQIDLPILICPSDDSTRSEPQGEALSFVVNAGIPDAPFPRDEKQQATWVTDIRANGIFHNHTLYPRSFHGMPTPSLRRSLWVSTDYIASHDGASNTMLLSENVDAKRWHATRDHHTTMVWKADKQYPINVETGRTQGRTLDDWHKYCRPSSFHSGGVNVVFADGHGQFLRDDIPYWVYAQLMTPDGKNALIDVNNSAPAPEEYKQVLSASDYE